MRAATTSFLPRSRASSSLARKLAGPTADAQRFEAACRLAAAQIDVLDIREARLPLLARALEDRAAIKSLATLYRYESDARSLRRSVAPKLAAARAAASTGSGETILNETSDNGIDIAAVLRRLSRKPTAFRPPVGKDRVGPVSILSANEAKFRERNCPGSGRNCLT